MSFMFNVYLHLIFGCRYENIGIDILHHRAIMQLVLVTQGATLRDPADC